MERREMKLNEKQLADLERNHRLGLTPDWFYYANNGRSAQENYMEIKAIQQKEIREMLAKRAEEKALKAFIDKEIEKAVDKALKDITIDIKL